MKPLYLLFVSFVIIASSSCQEQIEEETWINFKYDEARAYYFSNNSLETQANSEILVNGRLNPSIINPKGSELDSIQISFIGHALNGNYNRGESTPADCFIPHHGLVFYKSHQIVAHISICFTCNHTKSVPRNNLNQTKILENMFIELGIPISPEEFFPISTLSKNI